jgi:dihydrodipicolinate synthase/N-acetylneuraminate lyase
VAQSAILKIDIVSDARKSKAGFKEASSDLDRLGRDADKSSSRFSGATGRMSGAMKGAALGIKAGVVGIAGALGG